MSNPNKIPFKRGEDTNRDATLRSLSAVQAEYEEKGYGYGAEFVEITKDQALLLLDGGVLEFGVMGEYQVCLRVRPEASAQDQLVEDAACADERIPSDELEEEARWQAALKAWLAVVQKVVDDHDDDLNLRRNPKKRVLKVDPGGRKYIRIVGLEDRYRLGVFCFVERANGDVLYVASWAQPTKKNPRGNIYDSARPGVNHYGSLRMDQM